MDTVIYVSEKKLSESDVAAFVVKKGGEWHTDPPPPNGSFREGEDVIYFYPPLLPSMEYAPEEIEEMAVSQGVPQTLILIDIGRSNGSPSLAGRFGAWFVDQFGGWLDGCGVLD